MKKILMVLLILVVFVVPMTSCENNEGNELVVGMELAYSPFETTDEQGDPEGISVKMVYAENEPMIVLNCDKILGNAVERAISLSYRYILDNFKKLNPGEIDYFQTVKEDERERYYRYEMIEALKSAYFDNENLERFRYYYHMREKYMGEKQLGIAEYDYYDGFKEYIELKVKILREPDYDIRAYIDNMINEYGIYNKTDEYKLMGLFWFLLADREGLDVLMRDDVRVDRYKLYALQFL